ncbi:MAG: M14 family zinc carboxypeptidase [Pseudomonadota bacterium]
MAMERLLQACLAFSLGLAAGVLPASEADHPDLEYPTSIVRAFFDDPQLVRDLAAHVEPWDVDFHKGFVILEASAYDREQLEAAGFRVVEDAAWTQRFHDSIALVQAEAANPRRGGDTIPGFPCYRSVEGTYATAEALVNSYPDLATWTDIGDSWEKTEGLGGSDLYVLKITNSAIGGDKPKLFQMTSVHAREYTPAETNTRFAEYLLHNYGVDPDVTWLVDHHEMHLLLQANPDGREQAQTGLSWRKNTNQNFCSPTSTTRGADLNRNYPFNWGCCNGSSGSECSLTYRGTAPESEPETQAVTAYVRSIFPDQRDEAIPAAAPADATGIFLDTHSFSELVLWPWGFANIQTSNGAALQTLGRKLAWYNDYEPAQAISLYPTDGTTIDFAYGDLGLASFTFELGTSFFQSCSTFESTIYPDNLKALLYAAKVARTPYLTPAGPDVLDLGLSDGAVAPGEPVTLTATADDTRFSSNNGTEPTQDIAAAEVYFDVPPWDPAAIAIPLDAADGNFNNRVEGLTGSLDTNGLSDGRHILYARARDADGNWGPPSAAFLYVIDPQTAPRIAGSVRAADTGLPMAATIDAGGQFQAASSADSGTYSLSLVAGTYDLTVTPDSPDYGVATRTEIAAASGQTTKEDFVLYPFCDVFSDDVESGANGWTARAPWAITTETANSPTHAWTDSPGTDYSNDRDITLTSPLLDLSGVSDLRLEFAQLCDTEAGYDYCIVEVSDNTGEWSEVARYDGSSSQWENVSLSVSQLDGEAQARVRFRFYSDFTVTEDGWYVDDISLRGAGPACIGSDSDSDGIADGADNCVLAPNPDQRDTNGDGYGNLCDADLNDDDVVNFADLGVMKAAFFTAGDTDTDLDGDQMTDFADLALMKSQFFTSPGPSAAYK